VTKQLKKCESPFHGDWGKALGGTATKLCKELDKAARRVKKDTPFLAVEASTWRQMRTAAAILKRFKSGQKGVLLADDVGLGKTFVAALLAAVFAGTGKKVRVLAPNPLVKEKWLRDLRFIVDAVGHWQADTGVELGVNVVKSVAHSEKLHKGQIGVSTHGFAKAKLTVPCDLLIIDEAHRGSLSEREQALVNVLGKKLPKETQLLLLTATPFSIKPGALANLLKLCGAKEDCGEAIGAFGKKLDALHDDVKVEMKTLAEDLVAAAEKVAIKMRPFVIRHSALRLLPDAASPAGKELAKKELRALGRPETWEFGEIRAAAEDQELLVRMDRAQTLAGRWVHKRRGVTNDPRFHAGWAEYDERLQRLEGIIAHPKGKHPGELVVVRAHVKRMQELRDVMRKTGNGLHPKVELAAREIAAKATAGESVLVFCHHISTALEVGAAIHALRRKGWWVRLAVKIERDALNRKLVDPELEKLIVRTKEKVREALKDFSSGRLRVLVATDWLSEGLDMHEKCARLVHFEYSPSPLRTIQREGRLRRIRGGKGRLTSQPRTIYIGAPVFRGTRDEKLVEIMRDRIQAFDLLLGGVRAVGPDDDEDSHTGRVRQDVLKRVSEELQKKPRRLAMRLSVN